LETGRVERLTYECCPEVELISACATTVAAERILADVHGKALIAARRSVAGVQRTGTAPLVAAADDRMEVEFNQHAAHGDHGTQPCVVEA
jgi:hypothetical protein